MVQVRRVNRPKSYEEKRIEFFTRPYAGYRTFQKDETEPENDNGKHDWPVRDMALANKLMEGRDDIETVALNIQALSILAEVRGLVDATNPSTILTHNGIGIRDEGELYKTGFGQEVHLEELSADYLKRLYEEGADKPAAEGDPWEHGPCTLLKTENTLGEQIVKLHQVGSLRFNELGHLKYYCSGGQWRKIVERTRGAKGGRPAKAANDNVLPMAGRTNSVYSPSTPDGPVVNHRRTQSSFDPAAYWYVTERDKDTAIDELAVIRSICGRRPYEALEDAAAGVHIGDIGGGPRPDKRAQARGKTLVQVAIERLIECRAPKPALGNL